MTIDILLATYNGARFLPEQLASLAAQSHADWRLLVRDDGSRDDSVRLVREWAETVPQQVRVIEDERTGLGPSQNFATLLGASDAPYFAFCDQDDQWLPHKLETMLGAIVRSEADRGVATPALAFCDLLVVDEKLRPIAPSFWRLSRLPVHSRSLRPFDLLVRNVVTGCASMGNAALRQAALPIPEGARMHDWWLALVASSEGVLLPVAEPLIRYRQHGGNAVGALDARWLSLAKRFVRGPAASLDRARAARDNSQRQAAAFTHRFGDSGKDGRLIRAYGQLPSRSVAARKAFIARHRMGISSPFFFLGLLAVA